MTAGIMITASHNPKNYNGIKVYGSDGGQLLTEASLKLSSYIDTVEDPLNIQTEAFEVLKSNKLILPFKEETTQSYKSSIKISWVILHMLNQNNSYKFAWN